MDTGGTEEFFDPRVTTRPHKKPTKADKRRQAKDEKEERRKGPPLVPRNDRQRAYLWALDALPVVFASGEAGTGKTYLAARVAMRRLLSRRVERIIITRPTASDKRHQLGFLPGDARKKMAPWLVEILHGFAEEAGSMACVEKLIVGGEIEIVPFEHMRGRTFKNAVALLDEAQNCSLKDLKLFLTRIGEGTQTIINGDPSQTDISDSGFSTILHMAETYDVTAAVVRFLPEDVVRSAVAKEWVHAFHKLDSRAGFC